jgi:hypothetical protein
MMIPGTDSLLLRFFVRGLVCLREILQVIIAHSRLRLDHVAAAIGMFLF